MRADWNVEAGAVVRARFFPLLTLHTWQYFIRFGEGIGSVKAEDMGDGSSDIGIGIGL